MGAILMLLGLVLGVLAVPLLLLPETLALGCVPAALGALLFLWGGRRMAYATQERRHRETLAAVTGNREMSKQPKQVTLTPEQINARLMDARRMLKEKRWREARALLMTLDHPQARAWLGKMDDMGV